MREDPMLERVLAQHRAAVTGGRAPSADHPDVDTLARHAAGQLSPERARDVASHLLACDDGRCVAFVRSQAEDAYATQDMLYPSDPDAPARTRTFQCKAGLWDQFAEIAQERGISLDELIEEAMTAYARMRGHLDAPTDPRRQPPVGEETMDARAARARTMAKPPPTDLDDSDSMPAMAARDAAGKLVRSFPSSVSKPTPPPGTVRMPNRPGVPLPAPSGRSMPPVGGGPGVPPPPQRTARLSSGNIPAAVPPPPARSAPSPFVPPPAPSRSMPPALPGGMAPPAQPMSTMKSARGPVPGAPQPQLTLTYQGRPHVVDKDRFLLGRSKNGADLRLDDANVSRQHAMIEKVGGAYYVVDLGSTNGVFVSGERVARRALRDGDVIEITTHQITVTLV